MQTIPARRGTATLIKKDQTIRITNTSGHQVIDIWAFALPSPTFSSGSVEAPLFPAASRASLPSYSAAANVGASVTEYMSMSHTRAGLKRLMPNVGETLVSQKRAPMLTVVEDTTRGVHDTLTAACDRWLYPELGINGYHESCTDNCWDALVELASRLAEAGAGDDAQAVKGVEAALGGRLPDPWNLFMNISIGEEQESNRSLTIEAPYTKAGDYVVLKAARACVVVMSSCPQDVLPVNGGEPRDAHFVVDD